MHAHDAVIQGGERPFYDVPAPSHTTSASSALFTRKPPVQTEAVQDDTVNDRYASTSYSAPGSPADDALTNHASYSNSRYAQEDGLAQVHNAPD